MADYTPLTSLPPPTTAAAPGAAVPGASIQPQLVSRSSAAIPDSTYVAPNAPAASPISHLSGESTRQPAEHNAPAPTAAQFQQQMRMQQEHQLRLQQQQQQQEQQQQEHQQRLDARDLAPMYPRMDHAALVPGHVPGPGPGSHSGFGMPHHAPHPHEGFRNNHQYAYSMHQQELQDLQRSKQRAARISDLLVSGLLPAIAALLFLVFSTQQGREFFAGIARPFGLVLPDSLTELTLAGNAGKAALFGAVFAGCASAL